MSEIKKEIKVYLAEAREIVDEYTKGTPKNSQDTFQISLLTVEIAKMIQLEELHKKKV